MSGKLIIFDLDDTLLNCEGAVSDYTLAILERVRAGGNLLVFNTARSKMRSEKIFDLVRPDYGIYNGGAHITDKDGNTIFEKMIEKDVCNAIVSDLFAVTDRFSMQSDWFYSANEDYNAPDVKFFDFKSCEFPTGAYKIIAFSNDPERLLPIADKYDLDFMSYFGGPFCRFTRRGVTKAYGNRKLAEILCKDPDDIIAFGDDVGDLRMLYEAGVGVLMKNATEQIQKDAKGITVSQYTNDEDGVARFLEDYFNLGENL